MTTATATVETAAHERGEVACFHCGLPVAECLVAADGEASFCCAGCEVAYETIHGCGLEAYYGLRERFADQRQAAAGAGKRYAAFDSEAFLEKNATPAPAGLRAIDFRLEGVHCAACVWLIEKLPRLTPGVVEARLSLGSSRARVVWDPQQVPLSRVAEALDRLGYAPHAARDSSARAARDRAERARLVNLAIAGALAGNNMLIAIALYAGVFEGIEPRFATLFRVLSMAIGWLSVAWPGRAFFRGAIGALRAGAANLDQPIALALAVGAVAGTANVLLGRGEVYFDSLSVLVFLLLVGRYLQARQQRWAQEAVGLSACLTPQSCRIVRDDRVVEAAVEDLEPDDVVQVRAGEPFPADGVVTLGESAMDASLLTGESRPIAVAKGDEVCAGAQNVGATLRVRVAQVGDATRIGRLTRLVEDGLATKPQIVQFADRVAGWFVLIVSALAAANLVWWCVTVGVTEGVDATVALLIVACPCALGLATPLTMAVAIGRGARDGLLIKNAAVFERLAEVDESRPGQLCLDKTGTLTTGRLRAVSFSGDRRLQPWIAAIESESNHPIARALVEGFGDGTDESQYVLRDRIERHGHGVSALSPDGEVIVGSSAFLKDRGVQLADTTLQAISAAQASGATTVVAFAERLGQAVIALADDPHADARASVESLRNAGWRPRVVSGDAAGPALKLGAAVGLSGDEVVSEAAPEDKLALVRAAVDAGERVVMVGDGVNDSAALAAADVGVAVRGGAEASLVAADVYFADAGVGGLVRLVELAQRTMRVARRNLVISLAYNVAAVGLAAMGVITPLAAALIMPLSSLSVLASAVGFTPRRPMELPTEGEPCR